MKQVFKLFKRTKTKEFNTSWDYVEGTNTTTFKQCKTILNNIILKHKKYNLTPLIKERIQFEIRCFDGKYLLGTWRYDFDLKKIDFVPNPNQLPF